MYIACISLSTFLNREMYNQWFDSNGYSISLNIKLENN
jgi:hypothetical protein